MREKIYSIIEIGGEDDKLSHAYDTIMMFVIIVSLVPLAFKDSNAIFKIIDYISTLVFILDYILRLITADKKLGLKSPIAFKYSHFFK